MCVLDCLRIFLFLVVEPSPSWFCAIDIGDPRKFFHICYVKKLTAPNLPVAFSFRISLRISYLPIQGQVGSSTPHVVHRWTDRNYYLNSSWLLSSKIYSQLSLLHVQPRLKLFSFNQYCPKFFPNIHNNSSKDCYICMYVYIYIYVCMYVCTYVCM